MRKRLANAIPPNVERGGSMVSRHVVAHNLPNYLTRFVGRQTEKLQSGGSGKTRLALETAAELTVSVGGSAE